MVSVGQCQMECASRDRVSKMRWAMLAFAFFSVFGAVVSDSPSEERRLHIIARPSIYEVREKKAVYCEGINVEPDQIEWIDNNGNVVEFAGKKNVRVYVEIRGKVLVLYIHQVLAQDEGSWICRSRDGTLNETLKVVVGEKAVLDPNETKRADENKSVKLSCKIEKGSPPPVVLWYKEENITSPIEASQKGAGPVKYVLTSNKNGVHYLEIRKLSRDDDGKYLCKATQKKLFHYSIKVITLEVRYKPVFYNPEIRNQPDGQGSATAVVDVFAVLNNTKNITCGAYANPSAKFNWVKVKNNKEITLGTDTIIEGDSSSTLTLNMADAEDAGQYKCTASNDMGSSIIIFHVTLGEGPKPPDHISFVKENLNHTFMTFEVTCQDCKMAVEGNYTPSQDDLPVTGYSFELVPYKENFVADWDHAEEIIVMIEDPQQTQFAVGPVANDTRYHARVRSVNLAGYSDWLEDQFIDYDHLPYTKFGVRLASSMTTVLLLVSAFFVTMCY